MYMHITIHSKKSNFCAGISLQKTMNEIRQTEFLEVKSIDITIQIRSLKIYYDSFIFDGNNEFLKYRIIQKLDRIILQKKINVQSKN